MRRSMLSCAAVLLLATAGLPAASSQDVSFRTDDGVVISASLYLPAKPGPAVILLHMWTRAREDWKGVATRLADAGLVALAIDLRGHGASDALPDGFDARNLGPMIADVKAARAFLGTRREVLPGRMGIAGASIGANLAVLYAATDPAVRSLVLLSPGLDYRGLRPDSAMKQYGDRPALLVASQEDNYAANGARQLGAPGSGVRDVRILNGAGHGTTMLVRQPDLVGTVVDWFRRTLL